MHRRFCAVLYFNRRNNGKDLGSRGAKPRLRYSKLRGRHMTSSYVVCFVMRGTYSPLGLKKRFL